MHSLHNRMIVARYNKQQISKKQLQIVISLLEQTINHRTVTLILRHQLQSPYNICFASCSSQYREMIDEDLEKENYSKDDELIKEIIVDEGQLLEIRFRGNVQPINPQQRIVPFAFNTHFPFYFETSIEEIDRYAQHLSSCFYGFLQIFSKQAEKKKSSTDSVRFKISYFRKTKFDFIYFFIESGYLSNGINSSCAKTNK